MSTAIEHAPKLRATTHPLTPTTPEALDALDEALRAGTILREGTRADYLRLAPHHYQERPPATIVRLIALAEARTDEPLGVLTVSMPTLNGAWRCALIPALDPRPARTRAERARALNRSLRTISRVIVHPTHRARGIATALVRAYLARPLTPCTEAIAAMGVASRFFARAGMREIRPPLARRDLRLMRALDELHIAPWLLADPLRAQRLARDDRLCKALRTWANDARATRALINRDPVDLARRAAAALIAQRRIYIHCAAQALDLPHLAAPSHHLPHGATHVDHLEPRRRAGEPASAPRLPRREPRPPRLAHTAHGRLLRPL